MSLFAKTYLDNCMLNDDMSNDLSLLWLNRDCAYKSAVLGVVDPGDAGNKEERDRPLWLEKTAPLGHTAKRRPGREPGLSRFTATTASCG